MPTSRASKRTSPTPKRTIVVTLAAMLVAWLAVGSVQQGALAQATVSSRPVLVLLCKYADMLDTFEATADKVQAQWVGPDSVDGLIREQSLGAVNLEGTRTFGWFTLPKTRAAYAAAGAGTQRKGNEEVANDCAAAARATGVDTTPYRYAMIYLSGDVIEAAGMTFPSSIPGRESGYAVSLTSWPNVLSAGSGVALHELGHLLGGDHTETLEDSLGGSAWSVFDPRDTPALRRNVNVGPGFDANNRDRMGFIPAARKATFAGGSQQYTLARLSQPDATNPMLVTVPVTATVKYVVSLRTAIGFDAKLKYAGETMWGIHVPMDGVRIQKVGAGTPSEMRAKPEAERAAAAWLTGETYTDTAAGITIAVSRADATSATINVTGPAVAAPTTVAPATTATPTTAAPTTVPATTAAPTTVPATTASPATSAAPTTAAPTTAVPTTAAPTTAPATTAAPAAGTSGLQNDLADAGSAAVPATLGPVSTSTATTQVGEPRPCGGIGQTVWVRFTAPTAGTYRLQTAGSDFDTVVAVYRGQAGATSFDSLTAVTDGCNDDVAPGEPTSVLTVTAAAGETFFVQAGGYAGAGGSLRLAIAAA